eukprot:3488875-Prymnesium_polylepis.1
MDDIGQRASVARPFAAACWEDFLTADDCSELLREVHRLTCLPGGGHTYFVGGDETPACALEAYALAIADYHMRCT